MSVSLQPAGTGLAVSGGMTLATAASLLSAGMSALAEAGESRFDLSGVTEIDSSGLAVLFAWQRAAQAQGKTLQIVNPPRNLISLAQVYGVAELLSMS